VLEVGGDHSFQTLFKGIWRPEARLVEFISGNLGARTELFDADQADGKLPSCNKGGEVKEVSSASLVR